MSELPADLNVGYTFVSALFYGLYLSTLFRCLRWLIFCDDGWTLRRRTSWPMLLITLVLCFLSTCARALDLRSGMIEAVNPSSSRSAGLTKELLWMDIFACTDVALSTLLADGALIYRCWIIYERSLCVVAFPVFLWFGGLALTGLQVYCNVMQSASRLKIWSVVNTTVGPGTVLMPFWASTILLNSYATFMIMRRIYRATAGSAGQGYPSINQLKFVMRILIESGFLYLGVAIAQFISWWTTNSYAIFIISSINISVTGIAFNLIIIRAAQHRVEKHVVMEPISEIRFRGFEVKSCVDQPSVNAQSFGFRNYSECVDDQRTSSTVSIV